MIPNVCCEGCLDVFEIWNSDVARHDDFIIFVKVAAPSSNSETTQNLSIYCYIFSSSGISMLLFTEYQMISISEIEDHFFMKDLWSGDKSC